MAERSVRVRLTAVVSDFKRQMGEASQSVSGVSAAAKGAEKESSRLGDAGRAIGMGMVKAASAATVAVGALGAGALKTGIAYNALEQSSLTALTTLLGSSQAATEQMAKLREFGSTSPFPRQVWIQAQQQLLAFGMAAEDIVPTLGAIQDAVAAAGGSATDIQEVVRVLAQVQSTGKVTAETLNQLGVRGIDAATLIGESMGKTAAQVRQDISTNAISGAEFIEVLTTSMTERFGGAAEGLRTTWVGAVDRIKGAFRDIGSALAEPFIAKAGGGAAVEWGNSLADIMRALEARILDVVAALGPSFEARFSGLNDVLQRIAQAIRDIDMAELTSWAQRLGPAMGTAAGGLLAFSTRAIPLVGAVNPLVGAFAGLVAASPELRSALLDLVQALVPLLGPVSELSVLLASAMTPALQTVTTLAAPLIAMVGGLVDVFAALPAPIQMSAVALAGLVVFRGPLAALTTPFAKFGEQMAVQTRLAQMNGQQIGALGAAYSVAATKVSGFKAGFMGALGAINPVTAALGVATLALGYFATKNAEAKQEIDEVRSTLDEQTGAITENTVAWAINKLEQDGILEKYRELGGNVADLSGYFAGNAEAIARVNALFDEHRTEFSTTVDGYATGGEAITVSGLKLTGTAADVYAALFEVNGVVAEGEEAQRLIAEAMSGTGDESKSLSDQLKEGATVSIEGLGEVTGDAAEAVDQLRREFEELMTAAFGVEEATDAQATMILRLKEKIDSARESGDGFSFSLKGNTLEAIDNRETLRKLVGGVGDMIEADLEAGLTKDEAKEKARQYKKQLEDELTQMGYNREEVLKYTGRVDEMVEAIDEIPDRAGVDVYVTGDGRAIRQIEGLQGVIEGLKNRTIKITAEGISSMDPKGWQARAYGGPIFGPGSETSDSIPALLSTNEHVWSAREVKGAGGHGNVERLRSMARHGGLPAFRDGGGVHRKLHAEVDSESFPPASYWREQFGNLMNRAAEKAWKEAPAAFLGSGRVLPRGSYRIGMPYLGYPGHYGADYPAPVGTPVAAVADGIVKRALALTSSYGKHIFLGHGARESRYAHLSSLLVRAGQAVKAGQVIGRVGSTGNSTGPHLHYEDRINGAPRNPARLGIFDRGGYLMPGQYGVNLSSRPERILSPSESETFDRLVSQLEGMRASSSQRLVDALAAGSSSQQRVGGREIVNNFNLDGAAVAQVADAYASAVVAKQRRAEALAAWGG